MKMNTLYAALSGAFLLGAATLAPAQSSNMPAGSPVTNPIKNVKAAASTEYRAEHERIESEAKAAKAKCKPMSGNARDICQAEAKATEKVAKKELDAKRKGTPDSRYDVEKIKAEAAYEVAKEKCEDLKGADQHTCKKQAKADEKAALAAAKANRKNMASNEATKPAPAARTTPMATSPTTNPSGASKTPAANTSGAAGTPSNATNAGATTSGTVKADQNKTGK